MCSVDVLGGQCVLSWWWGSVCAQLVCWGLLVWLGITVLRGQSVISWCGQGGVWSVGVMGQLVWWWVIVSTVGEVVGDSVMEGGQCVDSLGVSVFN